MSVLNKWVEISGLKRHSIAGLVLMTLDYLEARPHYITVWSPPSWAWLITVYFSLDSLVLIAAAYVPRNVMKLKLKDPMLVGVIAFLPFAHIVFGIVRS
ncbi:MAG: hypothetical protein NBV66_11470 [Burkholderiaceae bacterium]|nr:hypothetical protein [Burkholderiaceae bacterium]